MPILANPVLNLQIISNIRNLPFLDCDSSFSSIASKPKGNNQFYSHFRLEVLELNDGKNYNVRDILNTTKISVLRITKAIMKLIFASILLLSFAVCGLTQEKVPISQAEYVKLLYGVEANPSSIDGLIEQVQKRGINFELTSGIKSLTASKSKNHAGLKRTLEQALRRFRDPVGTQPPNAAEAKKLLDDTRANTLVAVEEMPDFVVKQLVKRGIAYAGTNTFRSLDHLIIGVSYLASGSEEYRVLSVNGIRQPLEAPKNNYSEVRGTSSTGEFVTILATIFKPFSETTFEVVDSDEIDGRRAVAYDFSIEKDKAQQMITSHQVVTESTIAGMKGRLWIDREKARVLKIESEATQIPTDFPITRAKRVIRYGWVDISDDSYLLPAYSEVRLTSRNGRKTYETRNQITFKGYKKYGSEVTILPDDEEIVEEPANEKPN